MIRTEEEAFEEKEAVLKRRIHRVLSNLMNQCRAEDLKKGRGDLI